MATRKKPCNQTPATTQRGLPPAYYRLHALLQTIRELHCHQDDLCALLHQIERTGRMSDRLRRDIRDLLNNLPAASLDAEVRAAYGAVDEAAA